MKSSVNGPSMVGMLCLVAAVVGFAVWNAIVTEYVSWQVARWSKRGILSRASSRWDATIVHTVDSIVDIQDRARLAVALLVNPRLARHLRRSGEAALMLIVTGILVAAAGALQPATETRVGVLAATFMFCGLGIAITDPCWRFLSERFTAGNRREWAALAAAAVVESGYQRGMSTYAWKRERAVRCSVVGRRFTVAGWPSVDLPLGTNRSHQYDGDAWQVYCVRVLEIVSGAYRGDYVTQEVEIQPRRIDFWISRGKKVWAAVASVVTVAAAAAAAWGRSAP